MLTPWLAQRDLVEEMSEAAGINLIEYGCEADDATVTDTAIAQPLIVAVGVLSHRALGWERLDAVAGHSVGEITALSVAGVLTPHQAVTLAAVRGRAMAEAASLVETSMSAIVGGERSDVESAVRDAGAVLANFNSARQVVAAGTPEQLAHLSANLPSKARVIPLPVAGAFHTDYMRPAVDAVRDQISRIEPRDPLFPVISNRDGAAITSGADALSRIVTQITAPVRWDLCQASLSNATALVEIAPAGVLVGLARHELRGVPAAGLTSPDDIAAARTLLKEISS